MTKQRNPRIISKDAEKVFDKNYKNRENQDGGVGRHTAPPRTTRTDRESNNKGDQHQENRK